VSLSDVNNNYSYEVLLRIFDYKKNEYISSQELISAAESLEVTTRIDQWVCKKVFKDIREKAQSGVKIPSISINLSGHSIVSVAFERFLLEMTGKYQVPTSCICFEITESVAAKSITRAQKFIHNLKAVGYKFSLDDFGVGYCSFNYLNQLDVDHVKIDGSFVSAMLDDATQFATVQAITNVARTMSIKTIAEFVEKPEIIKALKVIDVDYGQGYIFRKPALLEDIYRQ
jgi:EAL domain-containing protein (putative c-di-GMP-specific phosphodiesterase class I)|tara:strand:- start:792 stop:1478 length:687 start_codon:yes stop_codon:yes gene_type:complete